jgi:GNAT superfamily N-acetyltransferase
MRETQAWRVTTLRRAHPGDLEPFTAFVAGLSPTSSYRRFFTGLSRLPASQGRRLLRSDANSGAWLAWEADVVVGHAFWAKVGPATAELALVVGDRAQGRGLGRALGSASLRDAIAAGVRRLELVVQRDNAVVLGLIARRWPHRRTAVRDGLLVTDVALVPDLSGGSWLPRQRTPSVVDLVETTSR